MATYLPFATFHGKAPQARTHRAFAVCTLAKSENLLIQRPSRHLRVATPFFEAIPASAKPSSHAYSAARSPLPSVTTRTEPNSNGGGSSLHGSGSHSGAVPDQ